MRGGGFLARAATRLQGAQILCRRLSGGVATGLGGNLRGEWDDRVDVNSLELRPTLGPVPTYFSLAPLSVGPARSHGFTKCPEDPSSLCDLILSSNPRPGIHAPDLAD